MSFKILLILVIASLMKSVSSMTTNSPDHETDHLYLSQAAIEVVGSLTNDTPSIVDIIKVTSDNADTRVVNLIIETIVRNIDKVFQYRIQDYEERITMENNALLVVSDAISSHEIEHFLMSLSYNSHKKVLIVFLDTTSSVLQHRIKLILNTMWRKFILNVAIINVNDGEVHLNTYFPFSNDFCNQVHPVLWNIYRNGAFESPRDHFPQKNQNFFKCQLSVAVFHMPPYMFVINESGTVEVDGVDGNLLKTLSKKLNFAINYVIVPEDVRWGGLYANQTATGAMELVSEFLLLITLYLK